MIMISLKQIAQQRPCADGWARILCHRGIIPPQERDCFIEEGYVPNIFEEQVSRDSEFPLLEAFESNSVPDVLWALRCLPEHDNLWRKYAVWCARQVEHLMEDERSRKALQVAWDYSEGKATAQELEAARAATWAATREAAREAALAATREAAREAQTTKLKQILEAGRWVD